MGFWTLKAHPQWHTNKALAPNPSQTGLPTRNQILKIWAYEDHFHSNYYTTQSHITNFWLKNQWHRFVLADDNFLHYVCASSEVSYCLSQKVTLMTLRILYFSLDTEYILSVKIFTDIWLIQLMANSWRTGIRFCPFYISYISFFKKNWITTGLPCLWG